MPEHVMFIKSNSFLPAQRGIALMMVLWVMALMSIILAEFAFSMRTELKITANFKEEAENYYRAQAAIQRAMTEILDPEVAYHYTSGGELVFGRKQEGDEIFLDEGAAAETGSVPQRENLFLDSGYFSYKIEDEESKIFLNRFATDNDANRQILGRLLEYGAGIGEGLEADSIIDCIIDWLDRDDLHKMNGAEDDYYRSLSPPYECKDGPFDTVEELLMVKGITPEILFGSDYAGEEEQRGSYPGIAKFLTVWGSGGRFNRYTADSTTISIMYGDEAADDLDLFDDLGQPKQKYKSSRFSIIGRGNSQTGAGQRLIKAVVVVYSKFGAPALRIMYWNDNFIGYSWENTSGQEPPENVEYN